MVMVGEKGIVSHGSFGHRDMATTVVVKTVQEENMKRNSLR